MQTDPCTYYTADQVNVNTGEVQCLPRYQWRSESGKTAPFRCNSWRCPSCSQIKKKWLRYRLGNWAEKLGLKYFWTFTLDQSKLTYTELERFGDPLHEWTRCAALYLAWVWNKFRTALKRKYPKLQFILVREFHKNNKVMHLHVLVNGWIPQRWASKKWERYGGGPVCWVKYVDCHRVSGYLVKYISKMADIPYDCWPRGIRRFVTCQDVHIKYTPREWANRPKYWDECAYIDPPEGGCSRCPYRRGCTLSGAEKWSLYDCGKPVGPKSYEPTPSTQPRVLNRIRCISKWTNVAWTHGASMSQRLHSIVNKCILSALGRTE